MNSQQTETRRKCLSGIVLAIAIISMSSGGTWFALLEDTPAFLKASWRLWCTALIQLPFFLRDSYHFRGKDAAAIHAWRRWKESIVVMLTTGIVLAVHFSSWSWAIDTTSLTHSLIFVSSHPIILVTFAWIFALACKVRRYLCPASNQQQEQHKTQPAKFHELVLRQPSLLETTGAIIGFAGATITIVMSSHVASGDQTVTVQGDLAAVLGAIAMAIYLSVGRWLRNAKKLTLWMYVFPVTLAAALVNSIGSTIFETGVGFAQRDSRGWFGWFFDLREAGLVLALGGISGILGHTLANYSLKQLPSLVVSVGLLLEPVFGSILGWFFDKQVAPDKWTYIGGIVTLLGAGLAIVGSSLAETDSPHGEDGLKTAAPQTSTSEDEITIDDDPVEYNDTDETEITSSKDSTIELSLET